MVFLLICILTNLLLPLTASMNSLFRNLLFWLYSISFVVKATPAVHL